MAQNKKSVWSIIILVATIITLALLVTNIISMSISIPGLYDASLAAAQQSGTTGDEAQAVAALAVALVVVAFVFDTVFNVLKIIGGFKFSLQGRWGMFCIIVSIISCASAIFSLVSAISSKTGGLSLGVSIAELIVSVVLVIACVMHRIENNR